MRGLQDPTFNEFVKNLVETAKRNNYKKVLKEGILATERIVSLCEKYNCTRGIVILRDLAFIVLCFSGFLGFDEVGSLRCQGVIFYENFMSVHLFKSKID